MIISTDIFSDVIVVFVNSNDGLKFTLLIWLLLALCLNLTKTKNLVSPVLHVLLKIC